MSLIPEFKIGLWNAWLGVVVLYLSGLLPWLFGRFLGSAGKEVAKRVTGGISELTSRDKTIFILTMITNYSIMLYSITVPLKLGTMWFCIGLVVYIFGVILGIVACINYATTPLDEPIVKGVYKISRNPLYFFYSLGLLGISIAAASWLMLVLVILYHIPLHFMVLAEERFCLRKYGDAYREYMKKTARYFLFF